MIPTVEILDYLNYKKIFYFKKMAENLKAFAKSKFLKKNIIEEENDNTSQKNNSSFLLKLDICNSSKNLNI